MGNLKKKFILNNHQRIERHREEKKVYKLKKALYGLKQASRAWNERIVDAYFSSKKDL